MAHEGRVTTVFHFGSFDHWVLIIHQHFYQKPVFLSILTLRMFPFIFFVNLEWKIGCLSKVPFLEENCDSKDLGTFLLDYPRMQRGQKSYLFSVLGPYIVSDI
jgi:hypothetical protein